MEMRFGRWNFRSVYSAGALKTVASELEKYNSDPVAVEEVKWVECNSQPADDYIFLYVNGKANHHLGTDFFVHKGIVSAVTKVEFISNKMGYNTKR
jgi:hypothetical protein